MDIGGTFTDVVLEADDRQVTTKVLTTPAAPEVGVMDAVAKVISEAGMAPADVGLIIHGTTLATNALIERKGATTALIVTEGFRDSVEMAYENRFEQYDINMDRPAPLVPRHLRWPVKERMTARGEVLVPLDEASVEALIPAIREHAIESIAIGLIHSYVNPAHEKRIAEIIGATLPEVWMTLSSEVCPEVREYERQSTTCANAYVQPLMARYLTLLEERLRDFGFACPFFLMTSGGGLTILDTAVRFPVRLVESGPAGGAILASGLAAECALEQVLSFDMGGTTAKICLIDDATPLTSPSLEVAREYRFLKGSGLPVRIPAIEMVEIGAGGGSIATVDTMNRITVGPESAGADPGPACYDRGGTEPTVTDSDVALGRIDPESFAGGSLTLAPEKAEEALQRVIGASLNLSGPFSAFGVSELVDENMGNAARVHAIEWGKSITGRALIAFGGAAPLHAARLAEKLGLDTVIIPTGAGVGSAIGFLRAAIAYEVVRSRYMCLSAFDPDLANGILLEMKDEAHGIVREAVPDGDLVETRKSYMRYTGQGHEISVALPVHRLEAADAEVLQRSFDETYTRLYGRTIPGLDVEIISWTLAVSSGLPEAAPIGETALVRSAPKPRSRRRIFDPAAIKYVETPVYRREDLTPGMRLEGPALIVEEQTSTVVSSTFNAAINDAGYIVLKRR
ncbi:MAG: hydantoinase/oxoprolinase family protein [Rhodospirillales bacterium]